MPSLLLLMRDRAVLEILEERFAQKVEALHDSMRGSLAVALHEEIQVSLGRKAGCWWTEAVAVNGTH